LRDTRLARATPQPPPVHLREAAIKKLAKGQTSFEEVLRVTTEV
jgi:type II secretory ATPase GspE/PulE/Tfp pilus assembly ATPase PilB-like protein